MLLTLVSGFVDIEFHPVATVMSPAWNGGAGNGDHVSKVE
jgi:hypothetical protein